MQERTGGMQGVTTGCHYQCEAGEYCFFYDWTSGSAICLREGWYTTTDTTTCDDGAACAGPSCAGASCFMMTATSVCPGDCRCLRYCVPGCPLGKACWAGWPDYPHVGGCMEYTNSTYYIPSDAREVATCDDCGLQKPEACVVSDTNKYYCIGQCRL